MVEKSGIQSPRWRKKRFNFDHANICRNLNLKIDREAKWNVPLDQNIISRKEEINLAI